MLPPTSPVGALLDAAASRTASVGLREGQILRALVVQGTPAGRGGGQALLEIGRLTVPVRAQLPIPTGLTLKLEVARLLPNLSLRILSSEPQSPREAAVQRAALTLLPQQRGLATLTAGLQQASRPASPLPAPVQVAAREVLRALPDRSAVTDPAGLRRAIQESGLFLEAQLARAAATGQAPTSDLKTLLLRLLTQLPAASGTTPEGAALAARPTLSPGQEPPPPRPGGGPVPQPPTEDWTLPANAREALDALRQLVEGALARLCLHQLAAQAQTPETEGRSWLLELPVRQGEDRSDVVHLQIEQERRRQGEEEGRWSVNLGLHLPGLGALQARVSLQGAVVATTFWAERAETAAALSTALPELETALKARDLRVASLSVGVRPPDTPGPSAPGPLLDLRA